MPDKLIDQMANELLDFRYIYEETGYIAMRKLESQQRKMDEVIEILENMKNWDLMGTTFSEKEEAITKLKNASDD